MTLTTRPVRLQLLARTGAVLPGARVRAQLTDYQVDGLDVVPLVWELEEEVAAPGYYSATLWPNTRVDGGTQYLITADAGDLRMQAQLHTVPQGLSTVAIKMMVNATPWPAVYEASAEVEKAQVFSNSAGQSASLALGAGAASAELAEQLGDISGAVTQTVVASTTAVTSAAVATAARAAAELARDASFVTGPKYATEAIGRAAVTDGVNFLVQGSGSAAAFEYRRTNSTTSVLIATYPSKAAVDGLSQVFDRSHFTFQGYVSNGTYFANSLYRATDFLRIQGSASYTATAYMQGTLTHDWYDANKIYISSFSSAGSTLASVTATAPANARFLRLSTTASAGMGPTVGLVPAIPNLSIAKVLKIVEDNPPVIPSMNVVHGAGTVKTKLDGFDVAQAAILAQQAAMLDSIDLISDGSSSLFVNTWGYTKSMEGTPSNTPVEVPIISRVSDDTFTVAPENGAHLGDAWGGAIVVKDPALNRYASYTIKSNDAGTVVVHGLLPASISAAQAMHDMNLGQHLSRMGYNGLADYIVEQAQRFSYKKKKPIFYFHGPSTSALVFSNPNIFDFTATTKLIDVTPLGGAGGGGFVPGTNNGITRGCSPNVADIGVSIAPASTFTSRSYTITSAAAGDGFQIKFKTYGVNGFIDLPIAAVKKVYDTDKITLGRVRVQVVGDGVTPFLDKTYEAGIVNYLKIPFSGAQEVSISATLADSVPSEIRLYGIYAYSKSPETPTSGFFSSGDVVGFLGDSWTQFPPPIAGEMQPMRPDGSIGDGMQFLSTRLKERLAQDGINITIMNMGQGGRTSAWGRHWVDKMIGLAPKLTHCVLCFYVNDNNSPQHPPESAYTIDPDNMWGSKNISAGGLKGVVTPQEWFSNMEYMCNRLLRAGIKPIVLMPSHTASAAQTQNIQQNFLNRMAAGFNTVNADGGRV